MSKLSDLKKWFNLKDAAKRLNSSFEEDITVRDILQAILDGELELSWYLNNQWICKIQPRYCLHLSEKDYVNFLDKHVFQKKYKHLSLEHCHDIESGTEVVSLFSKLSESIKEHGLGVSEDIKKNLQEEYNNSSFENCPAKVLQAEAISFFKKLEKLIVKEYRFRMPEDLKDILQKEYKHIKKEIPDNCILEIFPPRFSGETQESGLIEETEFIGKPFIANGAYRLDIETGALRHKITDWLTDTNKDWYNLGGVVISDKEGNSFKPIDFFPLRDEKGNITKPVKAFPINTSQSNALSKPLRLSPIDRSIYKDSFEPLEVSTSSREEGKDADDYSFYSEAFCPTNYEPHIPELVIMREDIEKLEHRLLKPIEKPLGSTERNTLLVLIAAFCKEHNYDYKARGIASSLEEMTQKLGAPLSDDTIRKILKQIPDAIEARSIDTKNSQKTN